MARINPELFARLTAKLGRSGSRVYALIDEKVRATHLPRHLAAIALASESGINISRHASTEDLAVIRQAAASSAPRPVVVATPTASKPRRIPPKRAAKTLQLEPRRGATVWVVHGRNTKARDAMFTFLRAIGLQPLEWSQAMRKTKGASPHISTVLETAFQEAVAIVVLLTPDDEARLRRELLTPGDGEHERNLTGQARPNVLFEAGMAFGKNPNSTVLVQIGKVRPFSNIAGLHVLHMSNAATSRNQLAHRLADAGCNVNIEGDDWLDAGNFDLPKTANRPRVKKRHRS